LIAQLLSNLQLLWNRKGSFHFYFNASHTDSLRISITVKDKPLKSILDAIFKATEFQYAIDQDNKVYVTRKYKIETSLPQGFFDQIKGVNDSSRNAELNLVDYSEDKENEKIKSSLENKLFEIGPKTNTIKKGNSTIAGYVRDTKTGEAITGAAVYIDNPPVGVVTRPIWLLLIQSPEWKARDQDHERGHERNQAADHALFRRQIKYRSAGVCAEPEISYCKLPKSCLILKACKWAWTG